MKNKLSSKHTSQYEILVRELTDARYNWLFGKFEHRAFWAKKMKSIRNIATKLNIKLES